MHTINNKELNKIINPYIRHNQANSNWLQVHQLHSTLDISNQFANICEEHHSSNGWILMVNPENELVEQVAVHDEIDLSKVLRVSPHKRPIDLDKIKETLLRGNCSAVVLCNTYFSEAEMHTLLACAEKGNTHCIVLNSAQQLH